MEGLPREVIHEILLNIEPTELTPFCLTNWWARAICDSDTQFHGKYLKKYPRGYKISVTYEQLFGGITGRKNEEKTEKVYTRLVKFINDMTMKYDFRLNQIRGKVVFFDERYGRRRIEQMRNTLKFRAPETRRSLVEIGLASPTIIELNLWIPIDGTRESEFFDDGGLKITENSAALLLQVQSYPQDLDSVLNEIYTSPLTIPMIKNPEDEGFFKLRVGGMMHFGRLIDITFEHNYTGAPRWYLQTPLVDYEGKEGRALEDDGADSADGSKRRRTESDATESDRTESDRTGSDVTGSDVTESDRTGSAQMIRGALQMTKGDVEAAARLLSSLDL